jgi:hypothetical protein
MMHTSMHSRERSLWQIVCSGGDERLGDLYVSDTRGSLEITGALRLPPGKFAG